MFGIYRYILANMVVIHHLWIPPTSTPHVGNYAVFGFYMLSGYLMTYTLNNVYGFTMAGKKKFLINRVLRLYPPYLVAMLFSLGIIILFPDISFKIRTTLQMPSVELQWIKNIIILGLSYKEEVRLVPPAWSLYVELVFYILMALFLVKRRIIVIVWVLAGIIYTFYINIGNLDFNYRYFEVYAASLPFSIGSIIYHYKDYFSLRNIKHLKLSCSIYLINLYLADIFWNKGSWLGFYINLILSAYLITCLIQIRDLEIPKWLRNLDKLLGNISYPLFLCHWSAATIVVWFFFSGVFKPGVLLFLCSFPLANLFSLIIHFSIEQRFNKVRDSIRMRN